MEYLRIFGFLTCSIIFYLGDIMNFEESILNNDVILMEGALGERLKREYDLILDSPVALAEAVYKQNGKTALSEIWKQYIETARKYNLPLLTTTPTRRANKACVYNAGYDESIIFDNVSLLKNIKKLSGINMFAGGLMGCKGDAYTGEGALCYSEAVSFHSWQAEIFRKAKVDFLMAGIMPVLDEAIGMAEAMSKTEIPYIISFTIQKDGKLIDGNTIDYAVKTIDSNVLNKPVFYMTNCVHPIIVHEALSHDFNKTINVRKRFIGIQANTSSLSYEELDGSADLKISTPDKLALSALKLKKDFGFKVFGGCCGTDNSHIDELARVLK